jgi:hypothetical protein
MCELSEIVEYLKQNPVFCMSLASKELFHSNMLAWLLESCDSDDNLLSEIAKALAKLFMPKQDSENGYKVLTVLREKNHFDLIIVFLPKDDYDSINNEDLLEIKDLFLNYKQPSNIELLKKLQNDFRFAVVENKFKSIPNKEQLDKYNNIIKNRICFIDVKEPQEDKKRRNTLFSIVLNEENTTRYLMAPKLVLDNFAELLECPWLPVRYEDIRDVLLRSKIDTDNFTATFINHYANFLKNMLQLTEDIETNLEQRDNHAFPNQKDIRELSKIRIHDFYEKLWFSVLLNKIQISEEKVPKKNKGIDYSNTWGILNFNFINTAEDLVYGVQIQQGQFRLFVYPNKHKWKNDEYLPKTIKDYFSEIWKMMGKETEVCKTRTKDGLCNYGNFKYQYIKIYNKITIAELTEMIKSAVDAICDYNKTDLEKLRQYLDSK